MPDEIGRDLSAHRLERSFDDLDTAKMLLRAGKSNAAANRAYYSIFHAMRAVFALDRKDYHKHAAVISFFTKDYINTGHFDKKYSRTIRLAEMLRSSSDYADYRDVSQEEAEEAVQAASKFHDAIKEFIEQRMAEEQTQAQTMS